LFKRSIGESSSALQHCYCPFFIGIKELNEAKIHQLYCTGRSELHVGGFYIPMEDWRALAVEVFYGGAKLLRPFEDYFLFQKLACRSRFVYNGSKVFARYEIHNEVLPFTFSEVIGYFGEVGVVKAGQNAGFLIKLLPQFFYSFRVLSQVRDYFFNGTKTAFKEEVFGLVDRAHPSPSNQFKDFVARA